MEKQYDISKKDWLYLFHLNLHKYIDIFIEKEVNAYKEKLKNLNTKVNENVKLTIPEYKKYTKEIKEIENKMNEFSNRQKFHTHLNNKTDILWHQWNENWDIYNRIKDDASKLVEIDLVCGKIIFVVKAYYRILRNYEHLFYLLTDEEKTLFNECEKIKPYKVTVRKVDGMIFKCPYCQHQIEILNEVEICDNCGTQNMQSFFESSMDDKKNHVKFLGYGNDAFPSNNMYSFK